MRYIVIGLGKLGSVLADEFTQMGNEVIGIDKDIEKVERIKSKISTAICYNITDASALDVLPHKGVYAIIITVRQDIGACLTIYSIMKEIKNAKIYVRVSDENQANIMNSLGISNILFPEKDISRRYAMSLEIPEFITSYKVDSNHYIAEIDVPKNLGDGTIDESSLLKKTKLKLIAIKRPVEKTNALGIKYIDYQARPLEEKPYLLTGDRIILYGHYSDIISTIKE